MHVLLKVKHFLTFCVIHKYMELCERLKELRHEKGLTLKQVSSALQITLNAYANYEYGIREPSVDIIKRLCKFYNVSSDYLLGIKDD